MSTGFDCVFHEIEAGKWYYLLQNWNCPIGAWDWREYADAFGPFPTEERAIQHLREHHANPGGYSIYQYDPTFKADETLLKAIAAART